MSNDIDDGEGYPYDEHSRQERRQTRRYRRLPIPGDDNRADYIFERLDVFDNEDIQQLRLDLEYVRRARLRQERFEAMRVPWLVSGGLIVLGAFFSWLIKRFMP